MMRVADLCNFIKARDNARRAKEGHGPGTKDPIIAKYRFCNVRRNDDRVTKWLHAHWMQPKNKDGWFAFAVARCALNRIDTMDAVTKWILPWKPEKVRAILKERRAEGKTIYGAAYMIGTQGNAGDKIDFLIDKVLTPLWENRKEWPGGTLAECHEWLDSHYAVGSFTAGQIIADWKYANPEQWGDFNSFAPSGPGSRRGLNRIMGHDLGQSWKEPVFRMVLNDLRLKVNKALGWPVGITAHDIQNCLCEFDKYERARLGEGTPKQIYTPHVGEW